MKILHVYKNFFPEVVGGVSEHINQVCIGTNSHGITNTVLALTKQSFFSITKINDYLVYKVPYIVELSSTPLSIKVFKVFNQLVKSVDLVVYHFPYPVSDCLFFFQGRKKKSLVIYHSDIFRQKFLLPFYRPLQNLFLKKVDRIVATSENYLKTSQVLKHFTDKVSVIPIGCSREESVASSDEVLDKWRKHFPGNFFLFIGVIRYYKGIKTLISAAKTINCPIVIIGNFNCPQIEKELKQHIKLLEVTNIHFLGYLDQVDKNALLSLCTAFVFPSEYRSEAYGISLLEALSFGKPLISTEIGTGTSFINLHKETGLVIPPKNIDALRDAMQFLLDDPQLVKKMGGKSLERYQKYFTLEIMIQSYLRLYSEL